MSWTEAQLQAYNKRTWGTQPTQGDRRTPAAGAKKRNAPAGDVPLSVEAAYQIYQVKAALAWQACKVADISRAVYEKLLARADTGPIERMPDEKEGKDMSSPVCGKDEGCVGTAKGQE